MTQYELLKGAESIARTMTKNKVNASDVMYLEAYEELRRLEREGHKKTFIVHYLSERFGMDVATLYRVANRMSRQVTF